MLWLFIFVLAGVNIVQDSVVYVLLKCSSRIVFYVKSFMWPSNSQRCENWKSRSDDDICVRLTKLRTQVPCGNLMPYLSTLGPKVIGHVTTVCSGKPSSCTVWEFLFAIGYQKCLKLSFSEMTWVDVFRFCEASLCPTNILNFFKIFVLRFQSCQWSENHGAIANVLLLTTSLLHSQPALYSFVNQSVSPLCVKPLTLQCSHLLCQSHFSFLLQGHWDEVPMALYCQR